MNCFFCVLICCQIRLAKLIVGCHRVTLNGSEVRLCIAITFRVEIITNWLRLTNSFSIVFSVTDHSSTCFSFLRYGNLKFSLRQRSDVFLQYIPYLTCINCWHCNLPKLQNVLRLTPCHPWRRAWKDIHEESSSL